DQLFVRRELVPGLHAFRAARELGVCGHHARLLLLRESLLAKFVPAHVELALVASPETVWHLMRRMRGAIRHVRKERPIGRGRLLFPDPRDRLVGQVFTQVIALLRGLWRIDACSAVEQHRLELIHLAAEKAVELLEACASRPAIEWTRDALFPGRHLMALAELPGVVPVELEDFGDRCARVRNHPGGSGPRRAELRDD